MRLVRIVYVCFEDREEIIFFYFFRKIPFFSFTFGDYGDRARKQSTVETPKRF